MTDTVASCVFCKVIAGELPSHTVYEDDQVKVILSIYPLVDGHALVLPKKHVDFLWNADDELYRLLWSHAKTVAKAIELSYDEERVLALVDGADIAHVHIHLLPGTESITKIAADYEHTEPDHERLATQAALIKSNMLPTD